MQNIVFVSKEFRFLLNVDELNDCNPFNYLNGILWVVSGGNPSRSHNAIFFPSRADFLAASNMRTTITLFSSEDKS